MDIISVLILAVIPPAIVFLTAFFVLKAHLKNEYDKNVAEITSKSQKDTLRLRLQAYERLILLIERINPESMIMRLDTKGNDIAQVHLGLLATIRNEFNHNIAQQLYVSNDAWNKTVEAKDNIVKVINLTKEQTAGKGNALDFSKQLLANYAKFQAPVQESLKYIKAEAQTLF